MRTVNERKDNDWIELCEYVKKEILEYDSNMKIPKNLILKLQGLKKGQFIANNNIKAQANYDYKTILFAFKLSKNKIVKYMHDNEKKIRDENHKINLIIKMVEPEINDVYIRLKEVEKIRNRVENKDFENQTHDGATYMTKTKEVNDKMKKLF